MPQVLPCLLYLGSRMASVDGRLHQMVFIRKFLILEIVVVQVWRCMFAISTMYVSSLPHECISHHDDNCLAQSRSLGSRDVAIT
jgi:hypothetical protein